MYELALHKDAEADLDEIWEADSDGAADVEVLLEELRGSEELLSALRIHQRLEGRVHVSRLLRFDVWGKSLWRLKVSELADPENIMPYRIIYGLQANVYYVLAVVHRDRNYEQDRELVDRIKKACRELGIPVPG
jgi:hypothetical protein